MLLLFWMLNLYFHSDENSSTRIYPVLYSSFQGNLNFVLLILTFFLSSGLDIFDVLMYAIPLCIYTFMSIRCLSSASFIHYWENCLIAICQCSSLILLLISGAPSVMLSEHLYMQNGVISTFVLRIYWLPWSCVKSKQPM